MENEHSLDDTANDLISVRVEFVNDNPKQYEVTSTTAFGACKVFRSTDEIWSLYETMTTQIADLNVGVTLTQPFTAEDVQSYLKALIEKLSDAVFVCPVLLRFLDDDYGKSEILMLQTDYFFCQIRSLEAVVEKLESQNMKLFSMMQDVTYRVSCIESPNDAAALKAARRRSEPQLTERNLHLGLVQRRFSRRSSLRSNVTSLSATSAQSDERPGVPSHIIARRASHLTDTTDLTEDFEDFDVEYDQQNCGSHDKTDSPLMAGDRMNYHTSPDRKIDSPSNTKKTVTHEDSQHKSASSYEDQQQPLPVKRSSLAKLWSITGPSFETIVEEDADGNTIKSAPQDTGTSEAKGQSEVVDSRLREGHRDRLSSGSALDAEVSKALDTKKLLVIEVDPSADLEDEDKTVEEESIPLYAQSAYIEFDIIPTNEEISSLDEVVEDLISMIQPHEEQLSFRGSVQTVITRFTRRQIGTKLLEVGLHGIRCFLPDDPLRLGLFLPPSSKQAGNWPNLLCDKLLKLSEGDSGAMDDYEDLKLSSFFVDPNSFPIIGDHLVSGVTTQTPAPIIDINQPTTPTPPSTPSGGFHFFNANISQRLNLSMDSIQIEILSNPKLDLVTLTLLEDISLLVGKNCLFKRSLLVIRAWWMYETTAYVGTPIKHYFGDMAISMMAASLFNIHHAKLFHPLQVLAMFLAEYAEINWDTHCITLQGPVPFYDTKGHECEPVFKRIASSHLFSIELMRKYLDALYLQPHSDKRGSIRDSPSMSTGARSLGNASHHSNHSQHSHQNTAILYEEASFEEYQCESKVNHVKLFKKYYKFQAFEKGNINILHPLTYTNMVAKDHVNARRLNKIVKAFETGAKSLSATLRLAGKGSVSVHMPINSFFRGICSRFGTGWRPDVIPNSLVLSVSMMKQKSKGKSVKSPDVIESDVVILDKLRSLLVVPSEVLWSHVYYCNLLLHGRVTDSAVIFFCKDILQERGALPVGEVGKILQDTTAAFQLSTRLKEKYGGLKKFLELYESEFVMSQEHPFNPHVLIRKCLSPEDFEYIAKNIIPPAYSSKHKKMFHVQNRKLKATAAAALQAANSPTDVGNQWQSYQDQGMHEKVVMGNQVQTYIPHNNNNNNNRRPVNQLPSQQYHMVDYHHNQGGGQGYYPSQGTAGMYDRSGYVANRSDQMYPERHYPSNENRFDGRGFPEGYHDRRFDRSHEQQQQQQQQQQFADYSRDRYYDNRVGNVHEGYGDTRFDRGVEFYQDRNRFDRQMVGEERADARGSKDYFIDTRFPEGVEGEAGYPNRYYEHQQQQQPPQPHFNERGNKFGPANVSGRGRVDQQGPVGVPYTEFLPGRGAIPTNNGRGPNVPISSMARSSAPDAVPIPDRVPLYSSRDRFTQNKMPVAGSSGKQTPTSTTSLNSQSITFKPGSGLQYGTEVRKDDKKGFIPSGVADFGGDTPPGLMPQQQSASNSLLSLSGSLMTRGGAGGSGGVGATSSDIASLSSKDPLSLNYSSMFRESGQADTSLIDQLLGNSLNDEISFDLR